MKQSWSFKRFTLLLCFTTLSGCSVDPIRGWGPLDEPAVVVTAQGAPSKLAECLYRQLDATMSPDIHRTRPASGLDEIVYFGRSGERPWEIIFSPLGQTASTVTFRSVATLRGHDIFWRNIASERAACGF